MGSLPSIINVCCNFYSGLGISKLGSGTHVVLIDEGRGGGDPKVCTYCISNDKLQKYQYSPLLEYGCQTTSKVRFLATYGNTMLASDLGKLKL